MATTWTLLVLLICAVGSSSGIGPAPTRTNTVAPRPPSTSVKPAPTVLPAPKTGTPYILHDDDGEVCLMLVAKMNVTYTYKNASNSSETLTIKDPVLKASTDESPNCTETAARLILRWEPLASQGFEADPHYLTFNFTANLNKGRRHWTFDNVSLEVVFSKEYFKNYGGNVTVDRIRYNTSGFFNDTVEFERGYRCDAANDFQLKNLTEPRITAKLSVRDFHVQAFQFKTAGEFGNARRCLQDSGDGNKIVPIAVGVALAVLVILVIIAFFISKLVNRRRQTSYESLN